MWGQRGSVLVTILVLIVVLTVIGAAIVSTSLTEITIAFNQGDAAASHQQAEAGIARAVHELGADATWAGTGGPVTLGDGTYDVTVATSGTMRFITSTGIRGGSRQQLRATLKVIPRFTSYAVLANTTATIGSGTAGLTVSNTLQSADAGAVHANNALVAGTAITVNTAGATVIGALTANGVISGVSCLSWPWRCDAAFGTLPFPRIDVDSAAAGSLRSRAMATTDPADGRNLYFRGGDPSSRCTSGGGYSFGRGQTQRCWDKYVHDRGSSLGTGIANPVFFVEFLATEPTSYVRPTDTPALRAVTSANNAGGATSLTISTPAGVVVDDVMVAAIAVRGGAATEITPPSGWITVNTIDSGVLRMRVYYKVATAGEPASYTWNFIDAATLAPVSVKASGGIQAYDNVDPLSPIDNEAGQATAVGTSHSTPSLAVYTANSMLVASFALASGSSFTIATLTERYDTASTGGGAASRTTSMGADSNGPVAAGTVGPFTATSGASARGAAHLIALRPSGPRVDCPGYTASTETMCIRSTAATDSTSFSEFANSTPQQVNGSVVMFRRVAGTAVLGDIVFENLSSRTTDYVHRNLDGDPAFVVAGQLLIDSSGAAAASRSVEIVGMVYTFAGLDNPNGSNNLQGSAVVVIGIDVRHGANQVTLTFHGILMSNGSVRLQDTVANAGTVSALYDAAVVNTLPSVFAAITTNNVVLPVSWSSGD